MNKFDIEYAIREIMTESDFFAEDNPVTYMIFLDRYKNSLDEFQIKNTEEIIENLKAKMNYMTDRYLQKFSDPICQIPAHERPAHDC